MSEQMHKLEKKTLSFLKKLAECLNSTLPTWSNILIQTHEKAETIFKTKSTLEKKYELARQIEQYYGGMGSLNDIEIPTKCEKLKKRLYESTECLLRHYWKLLGNEFHDHSSFAPFPVGSVVKLVCNKIRYYERNGKPVVVTDMNWVDEQTWTIIKDCGPDITNMPKYLLKQGSKHMLSRHEAIRFAD